MRTQYDGNQTSELQVAIFQNGSEVIFTSKASSNKDIPGHGWGRVTRTEKGSETITAPVGLVEMTRVDGVEKYVAKFIGVIASSAKISGYFVDVNGRGGSFTMEKQVRTQ